MIENITWEHERRSNLLASPLPENPRRSSGLPPSPGDRPDVAPGAEPPSSSPPTPPRPLVLGLAAGLARRRRQGPSSPRPSSSGPLELAERWAGLPLRGEAELCGDPTGSEPPGSPTPLGPPSSCARPSPPGLGWGGGVGSCVSRTLVQATPTETLSATMTFLPKIFLISSRAGAAARIRAGGEDGSVPLRARGELGRRRRSRCARVVESP